MSFLARIAERMLQGRADQGDLQGLEGEGKPLSAQQVDPFVDPVEATGYAVMAKAGAVPEEVALMRDLRLMRQRLRDAPDDMPPAERRALQLRVAELDMRRNMAMERRLRGR